MYFVFFFFSVFVLVVKFCAVAVRWLFVSLYTFVMGDLYTSLFTKQVAQNNKTHKYSNLKKQR